MPRNPGRDDMAMSPSSPERTRKAPRLRVDRTVPGVNVEESWNSLMEQMPLYAVDRTRLPSVIVERRRSWLGGIEQILTEDYPDNRLDELLDTVSSHVERYYSSLGPDAAPTSASAMTTIMVCVGLASKTKDYYAITFSEIKRSCDVCETISELKEHEAQVLAALEWRLWPPTVRDFIGTLVALVAAPLPVEESAWALWAQLRFFAPLHSDFQVTAAAVLWLAFCRVRARGNMAMLARFCKCSSERIRTESALLGSSLP